MLRGSKKSPDSTGRTGVRTIGVSENPDSPTDTPTASGSNQQSAVALRVRELEGVLRGILDRYVTLVDSGDAGNWNPEEEPQVIAARAALSVQPHTHKGDSTE